MVLRHWNQTFPFHSANKILTLTDGWYQSPAAARPDPTYYDSPCLLGLTQVTSSWLFQQVKLALITELSFLLFPLPGTLFFPGIQVVILSLSWGICSNITLMGKLLRMHYQALFTLLSWALSHYPDGIFFFILISIWNDLLYSFIICLLQ